MYRLKSVSLLAALAMLFALVGYIMFGPLGAVVILVASVVANLFSMRHAHHILLRMHRARPISAWEAPNLFRSAQILATRAGIPVPALMVYPSEMPNAFALGVRRDQPVVAASTALLRLLDHRQVTAVLAHEFAHIKNRDSTLSLASGMFVQLISGLSQAFALFLVALNLFGGMAWTPWGVILILLTAPTGAMLLQAGLMRTRERLADRDAARLTRDPRALASALHRLDEYGRLLSGWMRRRFRFIYTSGGEDGALEWLRTHPTTAERVGTLMQMAAPQEARPLARPTRRIVPIVDLEHGGRNWGIMHGILSS